jgi:hypothetical protein
MRYFNEKVPRYPKKPVYLHLRQKEGTYVFKLRPVKFYPKEQKQSWFRKFWCDILGV